MSRLFLGLELPPAVCLDLQIASGGIPGARWQSAEQLHMTLHFLGEVDGGSARRLRAALAHLDAPGFRMQLRGAGVFPPRGQPRTLWVGVADPEPIRLVHQRCAKILDELGLERERRKFIPHVTLARLKRSPEQLVGRWVRDHALYESEAFVVEQVCLYSSVLSQAGAKYRVEAEFPLDCEHFFDGELDRDESSD